MLGKVGPHSGHLVSHLLILLSANGTLQARHFLEQEEQVVAMSNTKVFLVGTSFLAIPLIQGAARLVGKLIEEHRLLCSTA